MTNAHSHFLTQLIAIRDVLASDTSGCALAPQPCRVAAYPAGEVPLDACGGDCSGGEGMLWVNLQPTTTVDSGQPGCSRLLVTGQIGITRCSAPAGSDGLPDVGAIEANATQQGLDADAIADAVLCCEDVPAEARASVNLVGWTPIDNQGACYGGFWTVRGVYDVCCG